MAFDLDQSARRIFIAQVRDRVVVARIFVVAFASYSCTAAPLVFVNGGLAAAFLALMAAFTIAALRQWEIAKITLDRLTA